jgi:hypothetical protein
MPRRYLTFRTDRTQREFIFREIDQGRLRQGWGWKPEHDLRVLERVVSSRKQLTDDEARVWRNRRMLDTLPDGMKRGDVIVVPNLPDVGRWVVVRVNGAPYTFAPAVARGRDGADYGHIVGVDAVRTPAGKMGVVDPDNAHVEAALRASLRRTSRISSIDALGSSVDALIAAIEAGKDTATPEPEAQKAELFFGAVREAAWKHIQLKYRGGELEHLIRRLFGCVYDGARVERWGGASERGSDLLVFMRDQLGLEYKIALQLKQHDGIHEDRRALEQLELAREVHNVDAGIIVTTSDSVSDVFEEKRAVLEGKLGIDVRIIVRDELVELVMKHLGKLQLMLRDSLIDILRATTQSASLREHTPVTDRVFQELQHLADLDGHIAATKVFHQNRGGGQHLVRIELPREMMQAVVEPVSNGIVVYLRRLIPDAKCQRVKAATGEGTGYLLDLAIDVN